MKNAKPTLLNALRAKCHNCMCSYGDGKIDCENVRCSLYRWMPYRKLEPDLSWCEIHPRRVGNVKFADIDTSVHAEQARINSERSGFGRNTKKKITES